MFIAKSTDYQLLGYSAEEGMWKLKRIATPSRPLYRELVYTNEAKFVDKSNNSSFLLGTDGEKVLLSMNGIKQTIQV